MPSPLSLYYTLAKLRLASMHCIAAGYQTRKSRLRATSARKTMLSLFHCLQSKVKTSSFLSLHPPTSLGEGRLQADRKGGERKMVWTSHFTRVLWEKRLRMCWTRVPAVRFFRSLDAAPSSLLWQRIFAGGSNGFEVPQYFPSPPSCFLRARTAAHPCLAAGRARRKGDSPLRISGLSITRITSYSRCQRRETPTGFPLSGLTAELRFMANLMLCYQRLILSTSVCEVCCIDIISHYDLYGLFSPPLKFAKTLDMESGNI